MNNTETAPEPAQEKPQEKPPKEITIRRFTPYENGATRGFFDMVLQSGMILCNWTLFENDKGRWVKSPSKPFKDASGGTSYQLHVDFIKNTKIRDRFHDEVIAALDRYFDGAGMEQR